MRTLLAPFAAAMIAILASTVGASAQTACEAYRVKRGDTLREIAQRAFGTDNYRAIYRANARRIGRNPDIIRVGTVLRMPCPASRRKVAQPAETPKVEQGVVSLVTANGYLPYTDESLMGQGMFTQLVTTAMTRAAPDTDYEVVFVDDWSAHLDYLLPRRAFDASFPWTQPDCGQSDLGESETANCENFVYSDPFYEIVEGYFSRAGRGLDQVLGYEGFDGAVICRPEGHSMWHLAEAGLLGEDRNVIRARTAYECFERLITGGADIVAIDTRAGDFVSREMGIADQVAENPHLFSIQPLRVALHASNPKAEAVVADLNEGLKIMLASGEWTSVVSGALQRQSDAMMN